MSADSFEWAVSAVGNLDTVLPPLHPWATVVTVMRTVVLKRDMLWRYGAQFDGVR